ncbi:MBL fold metallo-hydrolase [bacterium]|nr:MBL fold metallo-hydrolase [bacterium]MDA9901995.1 MBL fold metallo-hydrolase [Gammaproteobacteria bacterium]MDC3239087.1 MBL fold metallo-hydrolase [Gammaproteobacteria bacterium]
MRKSKGILNLITTAFFLFPLGVFGQGAIKESETHRFEEVANGVWLGTGIGSVFTQSNVMVLVGEFDVLVVDSHVTPAASRALIDSIPILSDRPIRYLVNSHYHFDHAHGNQAFPSGIEIIGHEFTRAKLNGDLGNVLEENTFNSFTSRVPDQVLRLEQQAAAEESSERRTMLLDRSHMMQNHIEELREVVPTPPNITLDDKLTLFQVVAWGSREIQLLHFGRAHTGGDVVVYLPSEEVVFTGDMMLPGLAYMGDGHVDEWPDTLEGLKSLDFNTWLPGHGPVMRSKELIEHFQAYLRDLWSRTSAFYNRGLSADAVAEQIDMTDHSQNFAQIVDIGADVRAIRRIFELLDTRP